MIYYFVVPSQIHPLARLMISTKVSTCFMHLKVLDQHFLSLIFLDVFAMGHNQILIAGNFE